MAHEKSVTAVLVAYNSEGVITGALVPLLAQPEIHSIIVVDNCSTDETCELIKRDFPSVRLIENRRDEGFGRAANAGLNRAQTPFALLVSPDAALQEGAIEALLAAAQENPGAAILAPALYDEQGELHKSHKKNVWEGEENLCAEYLSPAACLFNMKLMRQVGFFDPDILLGYEWNDLCLRLRAKGHAPVEVPAARAVLAEGTSSGAANPETEYARQQKMAWARLYMEEKHRGKKAVRLLAARQNIEYSLKAAFYFFIMDSRRVAHYRGRLQGIFDYLEGRAA